MTQQATPPALRRPSAADWARMSWRARDRWERRAAAARAAARPPEPAPAPRTVRPPEDLVTRVAAYLEAVAAHPRPLTLAQAARDLRVDKSWLRRALIAADRQDLLDRVRTPRRPRPRPAPRPAPARTTGTCPSCAQQATICARGLCQPCYDRARKDGTLTSWTLTRRRHDPQEVAALLDRGLTPEQVAEHLGASLATLASAMRRQDRPDLARPFDRAHSRQRRTASRTGAG